MSDIETPDNAPEAAARLAPAQRMQRTDAGPTETKRKRSIVQASFERWRAGTGEAIELLSEEADWTMVGSSPRELHD